MIKPKEREDYLVDEIKIGSNRSAKTERSNSIGVKKEQGHTYRKRPETPHINLFSANANANFDPDNDIQVRNIKKGNESENLIKNFSLFMKQIIETQNENFLSGNTNVVEFIISKYLNINIEEIKNLDKLSLKINSDFGLLNQFGEYLTNLKELKLNNSVINSISDVGTSFRNLTILHVNNCGLKDLAGIICLTNLMVLEAASNSISDLIELEICSSITKLNLKNNLIEDEENIQFLTSLSELKWLNLIDNPISKNVKYDELIKENLPFLECLDKEDKEEIIEYDDRRLFESHSTFSSSPSFSNVNNKTLLNTQLYRPASANTTTNFFKSDKNLNKKEYNNNSIQGLRHKLKTHTEHFIIDEPEIIQNKISPNKVLNNNINYQESKEYLESIESKNKTWDLPKTRIFNFSKGNAGLEAGIRTKSQISLSKNSEFIHSQTGTNFYRNNIILNNQHTLPTLRPVITKKETPFEIKQQTFRRATDTADKHKDKDDLTNEIIKKLEKNKLEKEGQAKSFKIGLFNKHKQTMSPIKHTSDINTLKSSLIFSKDVRPLKLKVLNKSSNLINNEYNEDHQ